MPHRKSAGQAKLGRKRDYRNMMVRNLATSLVLHEKITTTSAKAKLVKGYVDQVLASAMRDKIERREQLRRLSAKLTTSKAALKVLDDIRPRYEGRAGGYVSIYGAGFRKGDGARLKVLALVPGKEPVKKQTETAAPKKSVLGKEKVTVKRKKAAAK